MEISVEGTPVGSPFQELLSAIHTLAQASAKGSASSAHKMNKISEGINNLCTSLQSLPAAGQYQGTLDALPSFSGRRAPRGRSLGKGHRVAISYKEHCAMLFGQCLREGMLPPPATHDERRAWINRGNLGNMEASSDEEDEAESSNDEAPRENLDESAMQLDDDPDFPYPNGPGHRVASPQALQIVWRLMCKHGVKSFRPDLGASMSTPTNRFLWNLAIHTFLKLVKAGEYESLTLELCDREKVNRAFATHVEGHLMRQYRQTNHWTEQQRALAALGRKRNGCRANLKNCRQDEAVAHPALVCLVPIIADCCSDDKTDHEAPPTPPAPSDPTRESEQKVKRRVILRLPWRHNRVQRILVALDRLKERRLKYEVKKPNTPPPRVRRRPLVEEAKTSQLTHPKGLPIKFYNEEWLKSMSTFELQELNAKVEGPRLDYLLGVLESMLDSVLSFSPQPQPGASTREPQDSTFLHHIALPPG
ncbi:hypothetical protein VP01_2964g5 [Puccinia sorghi]|uniref:Uncharacterized protein n=1 Tax=Puccinia sorghi TaxID=27349 RepID=A0A0L6V0U3_9BASI|nr:hypothetical protein VP01_2964g5 [Puccinia sorghi]